jgi:Acetyltransferase (GNAT) domain
MMKPFGHLVGNKRNRIIFFSGPAALSSETGDAGQNGEQGSAEHPRTVFQEDWWLDAASDGRADTVCVNWEGRKVASLAFLRRNRLGYRWLAMPRYTRTLGPVLSLPPSAPAQMATNMRRVVRELLNRLPPHDFFHQYLDPDDNSGFAFLLAGCEVGQHFTFRIMPDTPLESVFERIDGRTRRLIRSCRQQLSVETSTDLDRFIRLSYKDRLGSSNRHDFAAITRIFEACIRRGQATILTAAGEDGYDRACTVLVWGGGVLYYFLPARDRDLATGGSNALLVWEAIRFAHNRKLIFDFDGFGSTNTAKFLLRFGIPPLTRSSILHRSWLGCLGTGVRTLIGRNARPF